MLSACLRDRYSPYIIHWIIRILLFSYIAMSVCVCVRRIEMQNSMIMRCNKYVRRMRQIKGITQLINVKICGK